MTIRIEDHLGLAHLACRAYKNTICRSFDYEDLFQAACMGLMRAAETYHPDLGKFSTYAVPLAKKYVRRLVATQARTVKCPQYIQDAAAKAGRPKAKPAVKGRPRRTQGGAFDWDAPGASVLDGHPTRELAGAHPIATSAAHFRRLPYQGEPESWARDPAGQVHPPTAEWSLDAPTGEDGGGTMHDILTADDAADPQTLVLAREFADAKALKNLLPMLTHEERFVIRSRLDGVSQPQIGLWLDVSKQRVGQIQDAAVAKLRTLLAGS